MTAIPYLDEMWSITSGCGDDMMSPGCEHCYARRMFGRHLWRYECDQCGGSGKMHVAEVDCNGDLAFEMDVMCRVCDGKGTLPQTFTPTFHADRLEQPLHWRKPRRVGVSFMGDLFHEAFVHAHRDRVLEVAAKCPQHTFMLLTKRVDEMSDYFDQDGHYAWHRINSGRPLPNVWLGTTICNQAEADHNIPILRDTPAAVRWVSIEPMLGAVDLSPWLYEEEFDPEYGPLGPTGPGPWIDWVVLGGETGPGARRMHARWAVDVWKQCRAAGVPFYWKQAGSAWLPGDGTDDEDDSAVLDCRELPAVTP